MNIELGTKHGDDVLVGRIIVNNIQKGILLPPRTIRQLPKPMCYHTGPVKGATSWNDGLQNTQDMAESGSEVAQIVLEKGLHIPSMDELEIIYRICKPGSRPNYLYGRSGINVSAVPPTYPYTAEQPGQTSLEDFRAGGPEAFETEDYYYMSSTRHPDNEGVAFIQDFYDGTQTWYNVSDEYLVCAVRWIDL